MQIKIENYHAMEKINKIIDNGEQIIINGMKVFLHPKYPQFGTNYNLEVIDIKKNKVLKEFYIDNYKTITIITDDIIILKMKSKFVIECFLFENFENSDCECDDC